jgi:asparagine synthase (glutamine-hydrolysing)
MVGMVQRDGAAVDRALLQRLTDSLTFRGPDGQGIWSDGPVGLGHTRLGTTRESECERQPCTLDGQVWVTADARIDGRSGLIPALVAKGRSVPGGATDAELVLHAYHAWGEDCVEHLIGDFAFALWDGRCRRLFCARDHLGAKPFFYADIADTLLVGNTLNCLRLHPGVSDRLNDLAIADFLLFGENEELDTTAFADIRRLPPAHTLTWSAAGLRLRRYWELAPGAPIQYRRAGDYVEHFRELLDAAVGDRLGTGRVAVSMSGGLDSGTIAATARRLLAGRHASFDLRAYTVVYDRLIPDQERYYAGLVARQLGIPIEFLAADDYGLFERRAGDEVGRPEPAVDLLPALAADLVERVAARGRVILFGWDGDAALGATLGPHFAGLLRAGRFGRIAGDLAWHLRTQRTLPQVGLRTWLRRRLGKVPRNASGLPGWLNPAFVARLDLRARWEAVNRMHERDVSSPRGVAYQMYRLPNIPYILESYDAGVTRLPLEIWNPLLDLRLLEYLLSLPPIPWCVGKSLLRIMMRDVLPREVCERPKSPLDVDPYVERVRQEGAGRCRDLAPTPALEYYVNVEEVRRCLGSEDISAAWRDDIRPYCLNDWLRTALWV